MIALTLSGACVESWICTGSPAHLPNNRNDISLTADLLLCSSGVEESTAVASLMQFSRSLVTCTTDSSIQQKEHKNHPKCFIIHSFDTHLTERESNKLHMYSPSGSVRIIMRSELSVSWNSDAQCLINATIGACIVRLQANQR